MRYFVIVVTIFLLMGCVAPTPLQSQAVTPTSSSTGLGSPIITLTPAPTPITDLAPYIKDTTLKQIEVKIQNGQLGTAGTIISATLRNDSREYRNFSLTCGYTLYPEKNKKIQQMILIQPLEFSIEPLGWLTVNPVTVCIEPDKEVPANGEYYVFGPMAEGDLKKLADCACQSQISPDDTNTLFTQQLAFWMVAAGKGSTNLITMSLQDFIDFLATKRIDQATIDSLRSYLPLIKLKTASILSKCGF